MWHRLWKPSVIVLPWAAFVLAVLYIAYRDALAAIREKANLNLISVWARAGREQEPLGPVPSEIWATQQFSILHYERR
jgi:hypothetical protein